MGILSLGLSERVPYTVLEVMLQIYHLKAVSLGFRENI